jgi:multicomponent Na+:H+ antiporter subunit E
MNFALTAIVLALGWAAVTGSFTLLNILFGAIVSLAALYLLRDRRTESRTLRRLWRGAALAALFARELLVSAWQVAVIVVTPDLRRRLKPGFFAFPLTATTDLEITLLANMITLTPGTLSVDVSEDRKLLFIHAIAIPDKEALTRQIASGFEAKVLEVFR